MKSFTELRKKFPWTEYQAVFEAADLFMNNGGPLVEHGHLKRRWGLRRGVESELRGCLATFFEGKTDLDDDSINECMGIINQYLDKEQKKKPDEAISLKECTLTEKLVLLNQAGRVTATIAKQWGIDPFTIQKALGQRVLQESGGVYYGSRNVRLQKLLEGNLEPGQAVYRVQDGKVQKLSVVGENSGKVQVAGEVGAPVEEEDPTKLATEDPDKLTEEWLGKVIDVDYEGGYRASIGESDGSFVTMIDDGKKVHCLPNAGTFQKAKTNASAWVEKAKRAY